MAMARRIVPGSSGVANLRRLSGGASQETWSFDVLGLNGPEPMILRRAPRGARRPEPFAGLETEAEIMRRAGAVGVPSPTVRHVLRPDERLGQGFVMDRVEGETLGRKILRDDTFAAVRPRLARRSGEILARIHQIDASGLMDLRSGTAGAQLARMRASYKAEGRPRPVFDLALRWLEQHAPADPPRLTLVHGDFRNGNMIIGPDGVRAVLDWEVVHLGDPMEDLGWICVTSWRFGEIDKPVGGFGSREDMFAGYEAAGGAAVDLDRVRFWEVLGTLRWGIGCSSGTARFRSGEDRSVERPMIARRASETEIDLLHLLAPAR
jgi:aminoglycoside phosphotransferase (APT) family kinase protein